MHKRQFRQNKHPRKSPRTRKERTGSYLKDWGLYKEAQRGHTPYYGRINKAVDAFRHWSDWDSRPTERIISRSWKDQTNCRKQWEIKVKRQEIKQK